MVSNNKFLPGTCLYLAGTARKVLLCLQKMPQTSDAPALSGEHHRMDLKVFSSRSFQQRQLRWMMIRKDNVASPSTDKGC